MHSSERNLRVTVFTPEPALKRPLQLLSNMWKDLKRSHGLAYCLFNRDIKARYRNSFLGYLWIFLPPIATTTVFVFLNEQKVIKAEGLPIPYPAYAMLGTMLWQNFADAVQAPLSMATHNRSILIRVQFPREALVLSGIYQSLFNFLVRLVLFFPILLVFNIQIDAGLAWFPLGILALILLGTTLGILLTPVGLLFKDIETGTTLFLGFWMLLTPVVYAPIKDGLGAAISRWNPVTPLLQTSRDWLIGNTPSTLGLFCLICALNMIVLFVGWILYRISMPHVIARIGS